MKKNLISPLLLFATLAGFSYMLFNSAPAWFLSSYGNRTILFLLIQFGLVAIALCKTISGKTGREEALRQILLIFWFFLLISEEVFFRYNPNDPTLGDLFPDAAYAETLFWVLSALFVVSILIRHLSLFDRDFIKERKWLLLLGLITIISCSYSPQPKFSLAWGFKLIYALLLLLAYSALTKSASDLWDLLRCSLWAFTFLAFTPTIKALSDPSTAFEGGRLRDIYNPSFVSERGGVGLILGIMIFMSEQRRTALICAFLCLLALLLGGGKIAIIAAILAAGVFFLLLRRPGSALFYILLVALFTVSVIQFTPVSGYFSDYAQSGQISNLTGRTDLWKAAIKLILAKPVWGYGFMASKFVGLNLEKGLWTAQHLHNGFLESLYNYGLIGFSIYLIFHYQILRRVSHSLKQVKKPEWMILSSGALCLYLNSLINSFFAPVFGGRPYSSALLFLSLVVLSQSIVDLCFSSRSARLLEQGPTTD